MTKIHDFKFIIFSANGYPNENSYDQGQSSIIIKNKAVTVSVLNWEVPIETIIYGFMRLFRCKLFR